MILPIQASWSFFCLVDSYDSSAVILSPRPQWEMLFHLCGRKFRSLISWNSLFCNRVKSKIDPAFGLPIEFELRCPARNVVPSVISFCSAPQVYSCWAVIEKRAWIMISLVYWFKSLILNHRLNNLDQGCLYPWGFSKSSRENWIGIDGAEVVE